MKNFVLLFLLLVSCTKPVLDAPILKADPVMKSLELAENEVPFFTLAGQSNMVGPATPRLSNALDAPTYSATPSDVYIYAKGPTASLADQQADNGEWQPLVLGTNNGLPYNVGAPDYMGIEMSLGATMRDLSGKPVYIIKAAFSATGVTSTLVPGVPGNWNNTNRTIFYVNHVKPALEDFRKDNPGLVPVWVGHIWWGGERDAKQAVPKATFKTQFQSMSNYMLDSAATQFGHYPRSVHIINIDFWSNTNEANIRQGFVELCSTNGWVLWDSQPYPKGSQLTAAQAAPIPRGCNNSTGACDDAHKSHLAMKPLGRNIATYCYNN